MCARCTRQLPACCTQTRSSGKRPRQNPRSALRPNLDQLPSIADTSHRDSRSATSNITLGSRSRDRSSSKKPKTSKRESDRLEREVKEWTQSKLDASHALYERHNKGESVEARARQQLTSAGRDITKGWTAEQCIGRAAVLVMKSMTSFSEHTLGLAYGLLDSHHFKLQHDSVIDKVIVAEVASAGASKVQLAVLFQGS